MIESERVRPEGWTGTAANAAETSMRRDAKPERGIVRLAWWVALLALCATLVGRWLPQGLPGSAAGIGALIAWTSRAGAFASQLFALFGAALGLRLIVVTLGVSGLDALRRFAFAALAAGAIILVLAATQQRLDAEVSVLLALLVSLLALGVAPFMLVADRTRAAGLALGLVGLATFARIAARLIADHGVVGAWPMARAASTGSFTLDLAGLVVFAIWLATRKPPATAGRVPALLSILVLAATLLAIAAVSGANPGAPAWEVVLWRALAQSPPAPIVPIVLRLAVDLYAALFATASLLTPGRSEALRVIASLAVSARASADVPALGLCLTLACLLGLLAAITARTDASSEP